LAEDPRPPGSETLSGQDRYRVRQGDDRVVYAVDGDERIVEIVKIGHRREVYRN
jgi:mRNA interferase RelE/StbE